MKNITKQYQDLLEGKMSKDNFMRTARREFPQWISSVNSFKDAVSILKSKRILTEADAGSHGGPIGGESNVGARHVANMWNNLDSATRDSIVKGTGNQDFDTMMKALPAGSIPLNKLYAAIKQAAEDDSIFAQMQNKQAGKFNPNNPGSNSILENEITEHDVEMALQTMWETGLIDDVQWKMASKRLDTFDIEGNMNMVGKTTAMDLAKELVYIVTGKDVASKQEPEYDPGDEGERGDFDDLTRQGLREGQYIRINNDFTLDDKKFKKGDFVRAAHDFHAIEAAAKAGKIQKSDFAIVVGSAPLREAVEKPEGKYKEATGKAEYDKFAEMDRVNYRQLMKGMEYELLKMPEISDENLIKAKKKAYQNLIKNPKAYLDLLIKNEKEVEKRDKDLRMQPVKGDNKADKANAMKVIKKDEGKNTQTNQSNRERAKGMPEGVKVMKESFVEQLRNYILSEMIEIGSPKTSFRVGEMVKTPKGDVGTVEEVTSDNTTKIKTESGAVVEYQGNVLKAHEAKHKMQEDEPDMRASDYDDSSFQAFSRQKDAAVSGNTATNKYGDTFEVGKTATTNDGKTIKILRFKQEQGKTKAIYMDGTFAQAYDIDGLTKQADKHAALKEKLRKGLEEAGLYILRNPQDVKKGLPGMTSPDASTEQTSAFQTKYKKTS